MSSVKKYTFFLLALVVVLAGCSGETSQNETEEVKELVFALDVGPSDTWVKATLEFAELVEEKSEGSIKVKVHDSGTLGAQRELLEGMLSGSIDGTVSTEPVSFWVDEIGLYGIPYLFESEDHLVKFLESEHGAELDQKMIEAGFRPLTYFKRPPRQITSHKAIESLEDLKGTKLRVPESPTAPPAFTAMGAVPTTMSFAEVYNALEQNVIDGQENPLTTIFYNNFHEVQEYVAMTNHQYQVGYFLISDKAFNDLSDNEKGIVEEAAKEAQQFEQEILEEDMKNIKKQMTDAGIEFTEPDVKEFAKAAQSAYSEYDPKMQEWIDKIQSLK